MELGDQWIVVAGSAGAYFQGIDHARLRATLDLFPPLPGDDVPPQRELFQQLQQLEHAAREVLNEPRR